MKGMMTEVAFSEYVPNVYKPTAQLTTAFVEIHEAVDGEKIVGLVLTNTTAGAVTASLEVIPDGGSTGTAANLILDVFSIAAHTMENNFFDLLHPYHLTAGDSIRLKASAATSITARLMVETPRT